MQVSELVNHLIVNQITLGIRKFTLIFKLDKRQTVEIHPGSVLHGQLPPYLLFAEVVQTSKCYLRSLSSIEGSWLQEVAPEYARSHKICVGKDAWWVHSNSPFCTQTFCHSAVMTQSGKMSSLFCIVDIIKRFNILAMIGTIFHKDTDSSSRKRVRVKRVSNCRCV